MYGTILVPTDGSDHARRAAEHASTLATVFDATVHVVSVVDLVREAGPFDAGGLTDEVLDRFDAEARERVESVVTAIADDVRLETAVRRGRPRDEILTYADEQDVDLIAMGTHGRTGLSRFVTGSVTEHVVRRADLPVLTVRATDRSRVTGAYGDVLVATDGSDAAGAAAEHGVDVAGATGARVHAVHVVDVGAGATTPGVTPPSTLIEQLESAGEQATESVAELCRGEGVDAVTQVGKGLPVRDLLDYADENDVDLIVVGNVGRSGLDRLVVGSTTERLIRRADLPVLTVRAGD